jgi:hypothetical protein
MEHAGMTDDTLMTAEPVRTAALRRWLREQEDEIRLLRGLLRECSPLINGVLVSSPGHQQPYQPSGALGRPGPISLI